MQPPIIDGLRQLIAAIRPGATLETVLPLGKDATGSDEATEKGAGYGRCLQLNLRDPDGVRHRFVFHTADCNQFDHDRRSDRAKNALLAFDTFDLVPQHVRAVDVGAILPGGELQSLRGSGEFYLLTEFADGAPYAEDLRRIGATRRLTPEDLRRCDQLVRYLASLHTSAAAPPNAYARSIRNLIGDGEGIFGIIDSYPDDLEGVSLERLRALEQACSKWRWRLRGRSARGCPIHGDFHPFNILFDRQDRLSLLDASRGCYGDPADDVTCLAVNYVFFALEHPGAWSQGLGELWRRFWNGYLDVTQDGELLEAAPPFLAWRALVIANPLWYPAAHCVVRDSLLKLAEGALANGRLEPQAAEELFS